MRKYSLRYLQILKLYYKKNLCKIATLYCCYYLTKILIIKSYLLRSKQRNVNFKQNEVFVLLKQRTNILKSLFVKTKLKRLVRIAFAKTILITKIINRCLESSASHNL